MAGRVRRGGARPAARRATSLWRASRSQLGDLRTQLALGQLGQRPWVTLTLYQRLDHCAGRLGQHLRSHRGELDAGFSELKIMPGMNHLVWAGNRSGVWVTGWVRWLACREG